MTVQLSKCRENHLDIYILAATVVSIDGQSCACFSTLTTQGPVQPLQQAAINLTRTSTCCGLSPDKYSRPVCLEVNHTRVEGPQLLAVVSLPWGELGARQDLPQVNGYCHLVGVRSRLHLILFPVNIQLLLCTGGVLVLLFLATYLCLQPYTSETHILLGCFKPNVIIPGEDCAVKSFR